MDGKVLAILPLSSSQTPSSGDAYLVARFSDILDSMGITNILRTILRGNRRFFVVLAVDAGFVVVTRNAPNQIRQAITKNVAIFVTCS